MTALNRIAIALLLLAEATLFFTFLFIVGPIATPVILVPLAAIVALSAALYWGQEWARWVLVAPIAFRVWKLVLVIAAAWGLGRVGTALFLTLITVAELAGTYLLFARYIPRPRSLATQ
jgi:hypothetical protein